MAPAYDIIIENGKIADGSGSNLYEANIYIRNGKIFFIKKYNLTIR